MAPSLYILTICPKGLWNFKKEFTSASKHSFGRDIIWYSRKIVQITFSDLNSVLNENINQLQRCLLRTEQEGDTKKKTDSVDEGRQISFNFKAANKIIAHVAF